MAEKHSYQQVMSRDLPKLLQQGCILVDIRRPEEWRMTGVVAGSHRLTFFDADGNCQLEQWLSALAGLAPKEVPLALICRTGHRTSLICEMLADSGERTELYNVTDGIFGWLAEGLPVVAVGPTF